MTYSLEVILSSMVRKLAGGPIPIPWKLKRAMCTRCSSAFTLSSWMEEGSSLLLLL